MMSLIHPVSLIDTVDACSAEFFSGKTSKRSLCKDLAAMLISRQVVSGSNSGFFLPYAAEPRNETRLFTGETLRTQLASQHLPLIEITRLLRLLAVEDDASIRSIQLAEQRMRRMCYSSFCSSGECRALTIAYMRYLAVQGSDQSAERLSQFLETLKTHRDGKGSWRGFPYFYTLLMLSEISLSSATSELDYSRPSLEKLARQSKPDGSYTKRRQTIIDSILTRS
jgi:hypothetical protein